MKLSFGPGGTAGLGYEIGLKRIKELGLDALEVEFTHGINMKKEHAKEVGETARGLGIGLSVHAPYYINLASPERQKVLASADRIIKSCEIGHCLGAKYVVFHPGFYQKREKSEVYRNISYEISSIMDRIKEAGLKPQLAPETTGKASAFGDLEELLSLKRETGCHITVDFAHLKARSMGHISYDDIIRKIKGIGHIHSHFSGIEWSDKGEKRHKLTEDEAIIPLAKAVLKLRQDITIINESPDPMMDAAKMKDIFARISGG